MYHFKKIIKSHARAFAIDVIEINENEIVGGMTDFSLYRE